MRRTPTTLVAMAALAILFCTPTTAPAAPPTEPAEDATTTATTQTPSSLPLSHSGTWTMEQLLALDRDAVLALWKSLPAVPMAELNGHYQGIVPNGGDATRQASTADFMYNESSERGYWLGKAYKPLTATTGEGYNRWRFDPDLVVEPLAVANKTGAPPRISGSE